MSAYFCHDNNLIARKLELFDSLSEDDLRLSVRVDLRLVKPGLSMGRSNRAHVGRIEGGDAVVVSTIEQGDMFWMG